MDANVLIIVAVAVALLAILYFAWPRKKAEPPRIEASVESVTPVVPVDPALQAASELGGDKAAETAEPRAAPAPKPKMAPRAKASKTVEAKAAQEPTAKPVPPKAKAAPQKGAPDRAPTEAKSKAKTRTAPAPAPIPAPGIPKIPDDIALLKGVGPKLVALLKSMGITSLEQIAAWSPAEVSDIDARLGAFAGRINRDNWVDQAKLLTAGDIATFEKKYGALGSEIKKG